MRVWLFLMALLWADAATACAMPNSTRRSARSKGCTIDVETDKGVSYDTIARILAAVQTAGGGKIGFQD